MKIETRAVLIAGNANEEDLAASFEPPEGALNVVANVQNRDGELMLCVTWMVLTPGERYELQRQQAARQGGAGGIIS